MSPLKIVLLLCAFLLGTDAKWIFAIEFERYSDYSCTEPQIGGHHTFLKEGHCKSWPDEPSFQSFRHYWVPHLKIDLNNINKYGACEIRMWASDDCSGEYVGQLHNANSYKTLAQCWGFRPGDEIRSIMVVCDKSKRPD